MKITQDKVRSKRKIAEFLVLKTIIKYQGAKDIKGEIITFKT